MAVEARKQALEGRLRSARRQPVIMYTIGTLITLLAAALAAGRR